MPLQLVRDLRDGEMRTCTFCGRGDDNELLLGKFYTNESICAHYYCLLFSSGLEQKGKDNEGILGFLKQDVEKESKRGMKLHCSKCRKHGATVGCCNKACKKTYHFPCGVESKMLNQYFGAFNSFCIKHQPVQTPTTAVVSSSNKGETANKATCTICQEELTATPDYHVLWAPCCQKQSWFHRTCMQQLALSAGYFFKCPICSDNSLFCNEMKRMGIYIPEQDASWELEPDAFQELVQRHNKCDHQKCICPRGRTHDGEGTRWELLLCSSCGSKGLHIGCGRLDWSTTEWDCEDCSLLVSSKNKGHSANSSLSCNDSTSILSPAASNLPAAHSAPAVVRAAVKRPYPNEESASSSNSSDDDQTDVDVTSVSDGESRTRPLSFPNNFAAAKRKPVPSRNVARRGRPSPRGFTSTRKNYDLDRLRFRVGNDSKIMVIVDADNGAPETYAIEADQPPSRRRWI